MSTNLAKQQLAPLLEAAKLPSLEVNAFTCSMELASYLGFIVLAPLYGNFSETCDEKMPLL